MFHGPLADPLRPESEETFARSFTNTSTPLVYSGVKCKRKRAFDNTYDGLATASDRMPNQSVDNTTLMGRLVAATTMKMHLRSVKSDLPLVELISDRLSGVWTMCAGLDN